MNTKTIFKILLLLVAAAALWHIAMYRYKARIVQVTSPAVKEVVEFVIATGSLRAVRQSALGTQVSGIVDQVHVDEGDQVKVGQVLVVLRQREVQAQIDKERASLERALRELEKTRQGAFPEEIDKARAELRRVKAQREKANLDWKRASELVQKNTTSYADLEKALAEKEQALAAEDAAKASLDNLLRQPRPEDLRIAEARVQESQAQLKVAEEQLVKHTIVAPFAGLVVRRRVEPGQSVTIGTALVDLADLGRLEIYVETDENNVAKLRLGQQAVALPASYPGRSFPATLTQIGPLVDHDRGVVELRLKPTAPPDFSLLDMTIDINIEVAKLANVPSVPPSAIIEENGKNFVFVVADGRARQQEIKIKGKSVDWIAIDGLQTAMPVVLRASEVVNGQMVRIED